MQKHRSSNIKALYKDYKHKKASSLQSANIEVLASKLIY